MTQIALVKHPSGGLMPADPQSEAYVRRIKVGEGLVMEAKIRRNLRFHRKFFALLNLAFESWEPPAIEAARGYAPQKNMDTFRRDLLILAGHCDATYHLDGSVEFVARSIAFDKLPDDLAFEQVYRSVLTVVWEHVLRHLRYGSPEEVDEVVQRIIRFE